MDNHLPIKVVIPRKKDVKKNQGGGNTKYFCEVNTELRHFVAQKFENLEKHYQNYFERYPKVPCVGKVKVKKKAMAKSYKPNRLFNLETCPIIGTHTLDEFYIKLTMQGLKNIKKEVLHSNTKELKANLTTIENIIPYDQNDIFSDEIKKDSSILSDNSVKLKLFSFPKEVDNNMVEFSFNKFIKEIGIESKVEKLNYSDQIVMYKIEDIDKKIINKLLQFSAVKKVSYFVNFSMAPVHRLNKNELDKKLLSRPDSNNEYPIIGIIDSGISKTNKYLEPWIYAREIFVPSEYQNNTHGTFVAGMIQYGDILNEFDRVNEGKFMFLDVVALPNSDKSYGPTDSCNELQLVEIINEVVPKYSNIVKIWNLSLGSSNICKDDEISDLAIFFDEIQDKYDVNFIIASGNYVEQPHRLWPPNNTIGENDRVTTPAESVRSITVGSIAHKDSEDSIVNHLEPSPFSRRGPGANFIVKPDVVDYGGNYNAEGSCENLGVISFSENGAIVEGVGTSYSTPRVTKTAALIQDSLIKKDPLLTKALLIHSTKFSDLGRFDDKELYKYYGFGHPNLSIDEILACNESKVTLLFDQTITKGSHLEILDFPYPQSLSSNNKWIGEIIMTLVYEPPLDSSYGQEYCRNNVEASLGTYWPEEKSNGEYKLKYVGRVPQEVSWDEKYEEERVKHGFKWSPIKTYYRNIPQGIKKNNWKMRVDLHDRNEYTTLEQRFVLIVTIIDPSGSEDIYTDVINHLRQEGFVYDNLQIKDQIKQKYNIRY